MDTFHAVQANSGCNIYRSPAQNNFLETLKKYFPAIDKNVKETYFLGDFNINMYENKKYVVHENNKVSSVLYNSRLKATNSMPNSNDL